MLSPPLADLAAWLRAATPAAVLKPGESLARWTTFRIGGPAALLVEAPILAVLRALLAATRRRDLPLLLLGLGSNLLAPDAGVDGVVVRLTGRFGRSRFGPGGVSAGAAVPLPRLARRAAARGLGGLEPLSGFPSTVGGAVVMNAGCYGTEIKDLLVRATVLEPDGRLRRRAPHDLAPAYRRTALQGTGAIVTRASFRLSPGDPAACLARIAALHARRWASWPSGRGNAGSIFKNPPGDYAGRLIEAVGLKGHRVGGAAISVQHANVFVNLGGATATDVLTLMREARRRVAAGFGIDLEPEIVLAGELGRRWREESCEGPGDRLVAAQGPSDPRAGRPVEGPDGPPIY